MQIPATLKKLAPLILLLAAIVFWIEDTERVRQKPQTAPAGNSAAEPSASPGDDHAAAPHTHSHEGEGDPHDDPEKNRRMGIFHYNEGNKYLKQKQWDQAVRNYKMALHHNKQFEEAHLNQSTAYLQAQRFDEAAATLKTLEAINPENPVLHYNLACYHSLVGEPQASLSALQTAVAKGYKNWKQIETDPDLANLRKETGFKEWMARTAPQ